MRAWCLQLLEMKTGASYGNESWELFGETNGRGDDQTVGFSAYFGSRNPANWQTLLPQFNPTEFDMKRILHAAKDAGVKCPIITSFCFVLIAQIC